MASLVTVFGGSGFLGRNTVRALAKAGYRVRVAVRYPNLAPYLPPMGSVGQIQLMKCNVRDHDAVARAVRARLGRLFSTGRTAPTPSLVRVIGWMVPSGLKFILSA